MSISTLLLQNDKELHKTVKNFLTPTTGFEKTSLLLNYTEKRASLTELLAHADTGSIDYKRFSFIIQLLWNFMNPKLNPFFYEDGTFEKGLSALMLSTGHSTLPSEHHAWDFNVGENLATSEGYVVFENEFVQLLYYPGQNKKSMEIPIFIIPPWINKYYIFDLSKDNSYIAWLNARDIPVYCLSWVNPDSTFSHQSLASYVQKGIHHAVEKALSNSQVKHINMVGYCVGGVALLLYAGWLAKMKIDSIASLTFLSTPFDFDKLDNLRLFMSEDQFDHIQNLVLTEGVFKGDHMMQTFTLLRTNELLIQTIIDQIYLGKKQKPMDFLFWNADITHLAGQMHIDFLRDIFLKNAFLKKPQTVAGIPVDLRHITCPLYVLGTKKDHIVPWESCFSAFKIFNNVTFCLGGSGHVAGIINPPEQQKYGYCTNTQTATSAKEWLHQSKEHPGSWWTHWHTWVTPSLGKHILRSPVDFSNVIENAPGRYALQKAPLV